MSTFDSQRQGIKALVSKTIYGALAQEPQELSAFIKSFHHGKAVTRIAEDMPASLNSFKLTHEADQSVCTCNSCQCWTTFLTLAKLFPTLTLEEFNAGKSIASATSDFAGEIIDAMRILSLGSIVGLDKDAARVAMLQRYVRVNLMIFHALFSVSVTTLLASIHAFWRCEPLVKNFYADNPPVDETHFAISQTLAMLGDTLQVAISEFSKSGK